VSYIPPSPQNGRGFFSRLTPPQVLGISFLVLIAVGTFLLMLPIAHEPGESVGFLDALFTATSAVCVTGLITVDTATTYSFFGEAVILALIQVGGLGIMTMSATVFLLFGLRISLKERILMQQALGQFSLSGVVRLTRRVLAVTLAIEFVGAVLLTARFWPQREPGEAIWWGIFHAISAFCNAGFDLTSQSLKAYGGDWLLIPVVTLLVFLGGIGFLVLDDLWRNRKWEKLSVHSKLAIQVSLGIAMVGWLLVAAFEWGNPATLGGQHTWSEKLLSAFFLPFTARTAGFNTVPTDMLAGPTVLLTVIMMFIGGSPGSTAGGIRTTTFGVLLLSTWATVLGRDEIVLHGRRLAKDVVDKALALATLALAMVLGVIMLLLVTESHQPFTVVVFEAVSALGTVGLTQGATSDLSLPGKIVVIFSMYIGRLGPLTLVFALAAARSGKTHVHHPEDRVMIG
jgi:trk system potassium uptake protein